MTGRKKISIVTPCYNEESNVRVCHEAVVELFQKELAGYDYEHIFCDNASSDQTPAILRELANADPHVKVILNSRNFGGLRSLFNGICNTSGDATMCYLPADLQDPPEIIPEMVRRWEEGCEVVYGIRKQREEGAVMRAVRRAYYRLVRRLADVEIPLNVGEFQLVDRCVVDALREFDDYYPYVRGMIASCGFRATGIEYTWKARQRGISKHRLYHLIDNGLNGLISFTNVPLRLCMFFGVLVSFLSLLYGAVALVLNIVYFREYAAPGIPTLIVAVFFFSGLQLFFFGVLGEYIGAIHFQVRKRPMVIERERINFKCPPEECGEGGGGPTHPAELRVPQPGQRPIRIVSRRSA
jgi:polyisoprenyl-phosphate glycosyltransferase